MKIAAYCGTREIYRDMETSAKSLVANSGVDEVHFVIEDAEFPSDLPEIVAVHDMSGQEWFDHDGPNMDAPYTYMAMMRIALCHVLPDADAVLSLDADTVCLPGVDAVWELPIEGDYLAASHEWHRSHNGLLYCNFGVVLYNLAKLRDGKADECIDVLNRRKYTWVEQDVCNYLCQGRIYDMPWEFNANHWTRENFFKMNAADRKRVAKIVHYAGIKDFRHHDEWREYEAVGWDEALERHEAWAR